MLTTQCWHAFDRWYRVTQCDRVWHSVCDRWYLVTDDCDRWYLVTQCLWQMISDKSWRATAQISSGGIARLWWQWLYNTVSAPALHQHRMITIRIAHLRIAIGLPELKIGVWVYETQDIFLWNVFLLPFNLEHKRREALFKGTVSWWNMTRQVCLLYRANNVLTLMSLDAVDENDNVFFSSASQWAFYQDPADTPSAQ